MRHETDWSALVSGVVFVAIGVLALAIGRDRFGDSVPAVWSTALLGLGAALLVRSAREHGTSDEISAERSEDREVEQAGGGHDG